MTTFDPRVAKLQRMATLLDSQFRIPYTKFRIGLDGIIGLIPFYGDIFTFILSLFIVISIARMGVPLPVLIRICFNTLMDFIVGVVPILGDFADIFFKSNLKNVQLAQKYFEQPKKVSGQSWLWVGGISFALLSVFILIAGTLLWMLFQILNYIQSNLLT